MTQRECSCCEPKSEAGRTVLQKQLFIRNRWAAPGNASCCGVDDDPAGSAFDRILHRLQNRRLSISCMAFQDAENLDLERLRDCCLSVLSGHKLIPFCAYNVTDRQGRALYRGETMTKTPLEDWIARKIGLTPGTLTREALRRYQLSRIRKTVALAMEKVLFTGVNWPDLIRPD